MGKKKHLMSAHAYTGGTPVGVLTGTDYATILKFYGTPIPRSLTRRKSKVEGILADKLCTCIKKVKMTRRTRRSQRRYDEPAAIAICNKNIFKNRGLRYSRFKCLGEKGPHFVASANKTQKLTKSVRRLRFSMKNVRAKMGGRGRRA